MGGRFDPRKIPPPAELRRSFGVMPTDRTISIYTAAPHWSTTQLRRVLALRRSHAAKFAEISSSANSLTCCGRARDIHSSFLQRQDERVTPRPSRLRSFKAVSGLQ